MFVNYRYLALCSFIFIITFLSSTASFCSELTSADDKNTPCFLEKPTKSPISLRSTGNSLVLPCHVARSKRSTVEWWYTDPQKQVAIKIYPVYPAVRPTVLRFVTSLAPHSKHLNETDILDASILLRHVNVDDSGVYRCIIRPWTTNPIDLIEQSLPDDESTIQALNYKITLTGPRLCQSSPGGLPCFTAMRTSSPTVLDAYQTAFLQCVIKNQNLPVSVFWVVGDASVNNVLITDHLTTNQFHGDRLRRIFPLSPYDFSVELTLNTTTPERVYSCVIEGANDVETTLFTYIIRTIHLQDIDKNAPNKTHFSGKLASHDSLNEEQMHQLRDSKKEPKGEEEGSAEDITESEEKESTN